MGLLDGLINRTFKTGVAASDAVATDPNLLTPARAAIRFVGATVTDVPEKNRVDVEINAASVADGSITPAKFANQVQGFFGRLAAGTGVPSWMTPAQATTLIDAATTSLKGAMSAVDKARHDRETGYRLVTHAAGDATDVLSVSSVRHQRLNMTGGGTYTYELALTGGVLTGAEFILDLSIAPAVVTGVIIKNGVAGTAIATITELLVTRDLLFRAVFNGTAWTLIQIGDGNREVEDVNYRPPNIGAGSGQTGVGPEKANWDHSHGHGNLAGGALHALATSTAAGFMSAAQALAVDGSVWTGTVTLNAAQSWVDATGTVIALTDGEIATFDIDAVVNSPAYTTSAGEGSLSILQHTAILDDASAAALRIGTAVTVTQENAGASWTVGEFMFRLIGDGAGGLKVQAQRAVTATTAAVATFTLTVRRVVARATTATAGMAVDYYDPDDASGGGSYPAATLTTTGTIASAGTVRLPNAATLQARNAANSADVQALAVDASNVVKLGAAANATTVDGSTITQAAGAGGFGFSCSGGSFVLTSFAQINLDASNDSIRLQTNAALPIRFYSGDGTVIHMRGAEPRRTSRAPADVATASTALAVLQTVAIATGRMSYFEFSVNGYPASGAGQATTVRFWAENVAGTVTIYGESVTNVAGTATLGTVDADVSGTNVRVTVTPTLATAYTWRCTGKEER